MRRLAVHGGQYGVLAVVAREAGVSAATVSKVVHRRRDVGARTRATIEALLAEHGYIRPWEADGRPPQILAVFRDLVGPYTLEVTRGIVDAATAFGASAVLGTTVNRSVSAWLDECSKIGAAGLVIVISTLTAHDQQRVLDQRLPVVLVDPLSEPAQQMSSIGVTNWKGACSAVSHLVELGHRRIAMVTGLPQSLAGNARSHGYRAALDEAGIAYDPHLVRWTGSDFEEAVSACSAMFRASDPPSAVFAASDPQALSALEAARRCGWSVPADLSVVSFDDTAVAAMSSPPLTAVRLPFEQMGFEAARILLQLANGEAPASPRVELATTLVVRQSTAPA